MHRLLIAGQPLLKNILQDYWKYAVGEQSAGEREAQEEGK